jgi:hypothetical protein
MSEDNLILLFCYLIFGITLLFLTVRRKNKKRILAINLTLAGVYSGIFLYNLAYNSSGGAGLLWLIYLMFAIGLHWLINLIGIISTYRKG